MNASPTGNKSLRRWWLIAAGTVISILIAILLAPPLIVLNVHTAWCRARLKRAIRHAWPATIRFLVRDDEMQWSLLLREEWLPHYASVTILVPPAEGDAGVSADVRLARRVLDEWGGWHKRWGRPVAVVVAPGKTPLPILVTSDRPSTVQTDVERLRQRLDALVAFARSTIPSTS